MVCKEVICKNRREKCDKVKSLRQAQSFNVKKKNITDVKSKNLLKKVNVNAKKNMFY